MTRFWSNAMRVLVLAATFALGVSSSYADSCSAIRSQMLSAGRGAGSNPQVAQLRRQLVAIQRLEKQRRCSAKSSMVGFFFNPCADLIQSKAQVQRQIASASNSGRDTSGLRARFVALGCAPAAKERQQPRQKEQQRSAPRDQFAGVQLGSGPMLFCVRLSDGYFFPAPKSQFAKRDDLKETVDQCRYICNDVGVDLYTLSDASRETEEMVALETKKPYVELPTAFRYRDDANFKACDVKRYNQRVAELRARTVTPANMANAIIPLPTAKPDLGAPDLGTVAEIPVSDAPNAKAPEAKGAAQHQSIEKLAGTRPVRVVGPAFFPED